MEEEIDYTLMDKTDTSKRDYFLARLYLIILEAHDETLRWGQATIPTQKSYLQWEKDYSILKNDITCHIEEVHGLINKYMVDWQTVQTDWYRPDGTQEEDYWWIQG